MTTINGNTLLHSGNIESYAVKYDNGSSVDTARHSIGYDNGSHGSISLPHAGGYISFGHDTYGGQLLGIPNGLALYYRGIANNAFSDWKTIAFTDSDITGNAATATNADKLDGYHETGFYRALKDGIPSGDLALLEAVSY